MKNDFIEMIFTPKEIEILHYGLALMMAEESLQMSCGNQCIAIQEYLRVKLEDYINGGIQQKFNIERIEPEDLEGGK